MWLDYGMSLFVQRMNMYGTKWDLFCLMLMYILIVGQINSLILIYLCLWLGLLTKFDINQHHAPHLCTLFWYVYSWWCTSLDITHWRQQYYL